MTRKWGDIWSERAELARGNQTKGTRAKRDKLTQELNEHPETPPQLPASEKCKYMEKD